MGFEYIVLFNFDLDFDKNFVVNYMKLFEKGHFGFNNNLFVAQNYFDFAFLGDYYIDYLLYLKLLNSSRY